MPTFSGSSAVNRFNEYDIKKPDTMKNAHPSILLIVFLILITFPGFALDQYQNKQDSLSGKYEYVAGVKGKALKLDGFRTSEKERKVTI